MCNSIKSVFMTPHTFDVSTGNTLEENAAVGSDHVGFYIVAAECGCSTSAFN